MSRKTLIPGLAALCLAGFGGSAFAQSLAVTPAWVTTTAAAITAPPPS